MRVEGDIEPSSATLLRVQAVQLLAGLGEDRLDANIILVSAAVSACEKGARMRGWGRGRFAASKDWTGAVAEASATGLDSALVAVSEVSQHM